MQMSPLLSGQIKNMHGIESLGTEIGRKVQKQKTKAIGGGKEEQCGSARAHVPTDCLL